MADLTARLLSENFEEALKELEALSVTCNGETKRVHLTMEASAKIIRELHKRIEAAKAEGAAEALEKICMDVKCGGHAYSAKIHLEDGTYYKLGVVEASVIFAHAAAIRKSIAAQASAVTAEVKEDLTPLIALDRQYLAGLQQGYIWGLAGEGEKYAEACAARAGQIHAARSPGPGKCECNIERNPSRMSAAALESGASAEIIGPICAYCKAAHQARRDTTVKKGTPA